MGSDDGYLRHSVATLAKDNDNLSELTTELRLALGASYDKVCIGLSGQNQICYLASNGL